MNLTEQERQTLDGWIRSPTPEPMALRAQIVLACAEGHTNTAVATQMHISRATVTKWRTRFLSHRLNGLRDQPRPGRPRTIPPDLVDAVIKATVQTTPDHDIRWSTRSMGEAMGMSASTISRIWRARGLAPHREKPAGSSIDEPPETQSRCPSRPAARPIRSASDVVPSEKAPGAQL
ncbi:helix-turn-helix domain-containing protein [Nonomuraea sp. NPDC059007]|uniref:helix-turn-helix domain-containing protein n=1 Tax=Nonomuraea sp. NPDC059007 TaxID=3346692 RepID=UPI0036A9AA29